MRSWLLTWNPARIDARAAGLHEAAALLAEGTADAVSDWTLGGHRHILPGDRLYLMRLGPEPNALAVRGIVAVGMALAQPFLGEHWDAEKAAAGRGTWRVPLVWLIAKPYDGPLVRAASLRLAYPHVCWSPQASGAVLPPSVAAWIVGCMFRGAPPAHGLAPEVRP